MIDEAAKPGPTPTERRRKKRTDRILETAADLLAAHGLEALTVARLAEALDYTPGALYRYFPSKDAILLGVQRLAIEQFTEAFIAADALGQNVAATLPSPAADLAPLTAIALTYRQLAIERSSRFGLIATSIADPRVLVPGQESAILPPFLQLIAVVTTALDRAATAEALAPGAATDRAIALLTSLMGVLTLHKVTRLAPDMLDTERLLNTTVDALLTGFGAPSQALADAREAVMNALDGRSILGHLNAQGDL